LAAGQLTEVNGIGLCVAHPVTSKASNVIKQLNEYVRLALMVLPSRMNGQLPGRPLTDPGVQFFRTGLFRTVRFRAGQRWHMRSSVGRFSVVQGLGTGVSFQTYCQVGGMDYLCRSADF
jgi:hypothetical protein